MLVTLKTHKRIYDATNMIILFNVFFWIKLLLKLPNILTIRVVLQLRRYAMELKTMDTTHTLLITKIYGTIYVAQL